MDMDVRDPVTRGNIYNLGQNHTCNQESLGEICYCRNSSSDNNTAIKVAG